MRRTTTCGFPVDPEQRARQRTLSLTLWRGVDTVFFFPELEETSFWVVFRHPCRNWKIFFPEAVWSVFLGNSWRGRLFSADPGFICCATPLSALCLPRSSLSCGTDAHLMFAKSYASSTRYLRYQHESAHLLAKGNPKQPDKPISDVLHWKYTGNRLHPTQKPLAVLLPLVETFSAPDAIVLDPFTGSGSSLVAAQKLGRSFIGIEMDAQYHAIASRRLQLSA